MYYHDKLVQVLCIKNEEIIRNCFALNTYVIKGTKKIITHINNKLIIKIDRRFDVSDRYISLGFCFKSVEEPNCFYIKNRQKRYNNCNLNFNTNKIYDCGCKILEKNG